MSRCATPFRLAPYKIKILLVAGLLARVTGPKPVSRTIRPDCRILLYPPVSIPDGPHLDPPTDPEWRHPVSAAPVYLEVIRYAHAHWILPPVINGCAGKARQLATVIRVDHISPAKP